MYLLNSKDEAMNMFLTYKAEVENQLNKNIKILKSDRGGEYESNKFSELCAKFDIIHQTTTLYTPQQNGIAERKNRTLKEMVNSMLVSFEAPQNLWGESLLTAKYILNRAPHKKLDFIPFKLWNRRAPSYHYFKMWGCLAKVLAPLFKGLS